MHTPGGNGTDAGLGGAAKRVADGARELVRLELELAQIELKAKVSAIGLGIALALAAALIGLYALGFALAGGATALATALPTWAALLIVAGALLLVAIVLGLVAADALRRGAPPVPQQAIDEAKTTSETLKRHAER